MHRLAFALIAALAVPACIDNSAPYDVKVDWTTRTAHTDSVIARITYDGTEIVTHGSLDSRGYTGTARVSGETSEPSIEICVELGNYEWVTTESGYGCESGDFECDVTTTREFAPDRVQCATVTPDETTVSVTF